VRIEMNDGSEKVVGSSEWIMKYVDGHLGPG
jgi:hypothetical protein